MQTIKISTFWHVAWHCILLDTYTDIRVSSVVKFVMNSNKNILDMVFHFDSTLHCCLFYPVQLKWQVIMKLNAVCTAKKFFPHFQRVFAKPLP
jgi:hypothetical protein